MSRSPPWRRFVEVVLNLISITIPDRVVKIGKYAFQNCIKLTSLTFGENSVLKEIAGYAFYNTGLTNIVFPFSKIQKIKALKLGLL